MTDPASTPVAAPPDAMLAAGLLWDVDLEAASVADLAEGLRQRVSPSTLWTRLGGGAPLPPPRDRGDAHLPLWRPVSSLNPEASARLVTAWRTLVAERPGPVEAVRVEVEAPEVADLVGGLQGVTGGPVSAVIGQGELRFRWRWPLRIGVAGPSADAWAAQINAHWHSPEQFIAVGRTVPAGKRSAAGPGSPPATDPAATGVTIAGTGAAPAGQDPFDELEIVIIDGDLYDPDDTTAWDDVLAMTWSAPVVIVVGGAPVVDMLERVRSWSKITVAVPEPGVGWWGEVYDELAHDRPLDLALRLHRPGSLISGIGRVLDATAVAHWALEVSRREPDLAGLQQLIQQVTFDAESQGARAVLHWAGSRAAGVTVVERHGEQAALGPDTEPRPPGEPGAEVRPPGARRLIAAIWDGERECRTVAPPERDLVLELKIAVPAEGEIAAGAEFPAVPTEEPVAELEVEVTSPRVWAAPQVQTVQLATGSDEPSTSAFFDFRSPAAGSAVPFDIVVRFRGRVLQTAVLTVPVRERAVGRDRIRFLATATTAGPEPSAATTAAEYSLSALTGSLVHKTASVPLGDVQALLDILEKRASLTLGVDPAPERLDDKSARQLLVFLARRGTELGDKLAPLEIGPEGTISVLVRADTPVLPIELVYQAEPPRPTARLCRHVTQPQAVPPPEWGRPCPSASRTVVCPYAFWGMYRTIIRDVELPRGQANPRVVLTLPPVLYAASEIADNGTPRGAAKPSDQLQNETESLFGAVARVTSWTAWRARVRSHPHLLVLLAHRETSGGETGLFIGGGSFLPSVDVRADVVGSPGPGVAPPLVLLMACASATAGNEFGTLPGAFAARGAAAVVGTLSKLSGPQGSKAGRTILRSLRRSADGAGTAGITLAESLAQARRDLIAEGLLIGLLLVSHGDIDLRMRS